MKYILIAIAIAMAMAIPCNANEWFDIAPKPRWHTGPLQTYQNPALGARHPWERGDSILNVSFDIAFSTTAGMSGNSHGRLLDFQGKADRVLDRYLTQSAVPENAQDISSTYTPVVMLINDFYNLKDAKKGDGFHLSMASSAGFGLHNVFMKGDAVSFRFSKFTYQGWGFSLDRFLNEDIKIRDSFSWLSDVQTAMSQWPSGYNKNKITPAGWRYAESLTNIGYPLEEAGFIAFLLEGAGLDFDNESADLFLKWLDNSLNDNGTAILDADILEGNKSGVRSSMLSVLEYGLTYSFNIPIEPLADMLSFGITAKYMTATRSSVYSIGRASKANLNPFAGAGGDSRRAFGLDAGIVFTPNLDRFSDLAVSLSGRNINMPSFEWNNETVILDPQFRLGASVSLFTTAIPIVVGVDFDLNRVESHVLPGYHTQQFRFQVELDPHLDPINFAIRLGAVKNIGDKGEPLRMQAGLGMQLWWFDVNIMGDTSLKDIYRSSQILGGITIPTTFSFSAQIGFNIEW